MTVAIKISQAYDSPATGKSRPPHGADANVVVKIPYRRPPRRLALDRVVSMTIAIKISHTRPTRARAGRVGPYRPELRTLLLRYHIAVCPVLALDRR